MRLIINGEECEVTGFENQSLLSYLREEKGLISVKDGCSAQGVCGCCSVLIDGKPQLSCILKMGLLKDGMEVQTLDGFSNHEKNIYADAFIREGGVQCGFCTPGIVVTGKGLFNKNPDASRQDIRKALRRNLCRCTGYKKIVTSLEQVREDLKKPFAAQKSQLKDQQVGIGSRLAKYDARGTVLGERPFVADLKVDGLLYGALKFSDHPRAEVLSIDIEKALQVSGVKAVFLKSDIPGQVMAGLIERDWPLMVGVGDTTHYIGDVLAEVVADRVEVARRAVQLIEVDYRVLEPVCDMEIAMSDGAPAVHVGRSNILGVSRIRRGDPEGALQSSAFVFKGGFTTQCVEHAFLEVESCLALPLEGPDTEANLLVYSQGQGVYEDRRQISDILGVPTSKIKVVLVPNGGGFGGKEDLTVQGHAALAAWLLQKPVRFTLTRDESLCMHPKKHPMILNYHLGCDADGKLTALVADILGDTGAYASVGMKVLERVVGHASGAYAVPHLSVKGTAVYTNHIPNGAMRGFGANQAAFAMESAMEDLCQQGGFDPWAFRYQNALVNGDQTPTGQVIGGGAGVRACLEALKPSIQQAENEGKTVGLACALKNTGVGNGMTDECHVKIEVLPEGKLLVHHGWTEMGQGVHTICQQVVCEELHVQPDDIRVVVQTDSETPAGMTTSSRATSLVGHALLDACGALKEDLSKMELDQLSGKVYHGDWKCDWTSKPGDGQLKPVTHFSYSYAAQCVILDEKGKIDRVVAAHDAGRIVNPTLFEGQIEGSIHMGLGYAISESFVQKDCRPVSTKLGKCGVLRSTETPEIEVIGVEVPDPVGPYGVKGVGEIGLVPTAGAVANALFHFDGKQRFDLPLKERFLLK